MRKFQALKNISVGGEFVEEYSIILLEDEKAQRFIELGFVKECKEQCQEEKTKSSKKAKKDENTQDQPF